MTALLDDFYAVLMGFGVKRTYIDYGLGAVLGISDGLALRGVVDDVLAALLNMGWQEGGAS